MKDGENQRITFNMDFIRKHWNTLSLIGSMICCLSNAAEDLRRVELPQKAVTIQCPAFLAFVAMKDRGVESNIGALYEALGKSDEDTPRLAMADELKALGDATRATLVEAQVGLSRYLVHDGAHRVEDLSFSLSEGGERFKKLQDEALAKLGSSWTPNVIGVTAYEFKRGFLEGAVIDGAKFRGGQPEFADLLKKLIEFGIKRIELKGFTADEVVQILMNKEVEHFFEVVAQNAGLTAAHVQALSLNPHLNNLRRLDLDDNPIGVEGIQILYNHFKKLRSRGRLDRYNQEGGFQVQAEVWIQNRGFELKMRRDAFLELVDSYGVTLNYESIRQRFPSAGEQREVIKFLLKDARFKKRLLASYDLGSISKYFTLLENDQAAQRDLLEAVLEYESDPMRLARALEVHLSTLRRDISNEGVFAQALINHSRSLKKEGLRSLAEILCLLKYHNRNWVTARDAYLGDESKDAFIKAEYLEMHALTFDIDSLLKKTGRQREKVEEVMAKKSDALFFRRLAEQYNIPFEVIEKMSPESLRYQGFDFPADGKKVTLSYLKAKVGIPEREIWREVTFIKPFKMKTTTVTQWEYALVMKRNPSFFQEGADTFEITIEGEKLKVNNRPVENISGIDAIEYAKTISKMTGKTYRLPTEAEWEYAARGGTTTRWYHGNCELELNENGWTSANSGGTTRPVAKRKPNRNALYDMHGNVWEWCKDNFQEDIPTDLTDPEGPFFSSCRVLRGGSWFDSPSDARSARRNHLGHREAGSYFGFRLVEIGS